jgi:uncharacterized protein with GYD domain
MIKYVTLLRFTDQGVKNVNRSTARAAEFREAAAKAGVTVETQLWTTGEYDGILIFSAADEKTALRCLSALAAAGNVRTETLRAFEAGEFQAIGGK